MTDFTETQKQYLNQLFTKLSNTYNKQSEEVKQQIGDLKKEIQSVVQKYDNKIKELEEKNDTLENKFIELDRKVRKNNIILYGLNKQVDLKDSVLKVLNELENVEILEDDISDVYCLGKKDKVETPVLIEFRLYQKKILIINNSKKLREKGIYVSHDLSSADRATTKILLKHRWEARQKGLRATIKGQKLLIGTELYTAEQLEQCNEEVSQETKSAPSTPNPQNRQKRLMNEFQLTEEADTQPDSKKSKTTSGATTYILRSTAGTNKQLNC